MARNRYYTTSHWKALKLATHQRDGWRCTVPGCTETSRTGLVCDHVETRPNSDQPTAADTLSNTRTLCSYHDKQIKEQASGQRRRNGKAVARGVDVDGWPIDPQHPWRK